MSFFAKNLKYLRENKGISKSELSKKINVNQSTLSRWENEEMGATVDNALDVANFFNVSMADLVGKDLTFDNAEYIDIQHNVIQIPVLGTIKAGIAMEAQEDVIEYVDIPREWAKGGKSFYGLLISGDSMMPKYQEKDIVIFEYTNDYIAANKKDCAVMVNGYDATFKNISISDDGITLVPLNINNSDNYIPTFYNKEQIQSLPVKIIGIAKEKRTRL
ncbi:MAG: XRE family transcriptional regulator [Tenericutes bacterium]|nr:XRE family transcriptional regulator [Mycoplasmatota bacterium]